MEHDHAFIAPLLLTKGGVTPHKLPLPAEVAEPLVEAGVRRVVGTVDGEPFRLALHTSRDGFTYIGMGKGRMQAIGAETGALVEVELSADPEPDRIDLGDELAAALAADPEARAVWETLTPGAQRSAVYPVTSAKRPATREDRALTLLRRLKDGTHEILRRRSRRG